MINKSANIHGLLHGGDVEEDDMPSFTPYALLPAAEQVVILEEFANRYDAIRFSTDEQPFPFEIGDYVRPHPNGTVRSDGAVYLVIDLNNDTAPDFSTGAMHEPVYGVYPDMRVARMFGDRVIMYWAEGTDFELVPDGQHI